MSLLHIVAFIVGILLFALGVVTILMRRRYPMPTDYKMLFVMGILWIPFGLMLGAYAFSGIGAALMLIGLARKKDWKQQSGLWVHMSKGQKLFRVFAIVISVLLAASIAVLLVLGIKK